MTEVLFDEGGDVRPPTVRFDVAISGPENGFEEVFGGTPEEVEAKVAEKVEYELNRNAKADYPEMRRKSGNVIHVTVVPLDLGEALVTLSASTFFEAELPFLSEGIGFAVPNGLNLHRRELSGV